MLFVGARSIKEDRVFLLRSFDTSREQEASTLHTKLAAVYGCAADQVEILFGTYPSPEAFFRHEPTWAAQFSGDPSFPDGVGV